MYDVYLCGVASSNVFFKPLAPHSRLLFLLPLSHFSIFRLTIVCEHSGCICIVSIVLFEARPKDSFVFL